MKAGRYLLFLFGLLPLRLLAASDPAKPRPPYRISGVAVSSRDGAPIPYCRIRISTASDVNLGADQRSSRYGGSPFEGNLDGFRSRRTEALPAVGDAVLADAHGRFSIEVPKAGAWQLAGIARGYRLQAYDVHETFSSAVVITDNAPSASVTLRLSPDAVISGVVFDEAGEPVASAQVQAEQADGPDLRPAGFAQTDDRGHYELTGLAPGAYRLRVDARPWYAAGAGVRFTLRQTPNSAPPASPLDPSLDVVYPATWYPGTDDEHAAEVLTLSGGEARQADFHLLAQPAARLSVPRTSAGSAEELRTRSVPVVLRVPEAGSVGFPAPTGNFSATADTWEVSGLAPGTYEVRLPAGTGDGEVRRFTVKSGGAIDLSSAQTLVRVAYRFEGDAGSRPQVTLTDTATGARFISGGRGDFGDFGGQFGRDREGSASGAGALSGISVPPGSYRVSVATGSDTYLASLMSEGAEASGETIKVTGGAPVLTLKMAAGRAQVHGVARVGEVPAAGAMVLLVPASADSDTVAGQTVRAETNTDGSFALAGVTPGPYILVVLDGGWSVNWRDQSTLAGYLMHGTPLELKPAAKQQVEVNAVRP